MIMRKKRTPPRPKPAAKRTPAAKGKVATKGRALKTPKKAAPIGAATVAAELLEQWLSRQDATALSVTRGTPASSEALDAAERALGVKLTKEARAVVERFGWLELSVSPGLWPYPMFVDGLRFFGVGDAPERLSLERQHARLQAVVAARTAADPKANFDFNRADSVRASVPVVSTLEGLKNAWLSRRDLVWFNDLTTRFEQSIIKLQSDARQASPLFKAKTLGELMPRLLERLDWRIERARQLRGLHDALSALGPCGVGGDQKLRSASFPDMAFQVARFGGVAVIRAERALGTTDANFLELNGAVPFVRIEQGEYDSDESRWNVRGCVDLLPGTRLDARRFEIVRALLEHAHGIVRGSAAEVARSSPPTKELAALVRSALGAKAGAEVVNGRFPRLRLTVPARSWGINFGFGWKPVVHDRLTAELSLDDGTSPTERTAQLETLARFAGAGQDADDRWISDF